MKFEPSRQRCNEESVLPLINVVFLLLIFFMIAGSFTEPTPFEVQPPQSISEAGGDNTPLVLLLGMNSELALDGRQLQEIQLVKELESRLKAESTLQLQVKADAEADALHLVRILELVRQAGIDKVQLLTAPLDGVAGGGGST